jgi:plastocyanin
MRAFLALGACALAIGCGSDYGGDSGSPYGAPAPSPAACTAANATATTSVAVTATQFVPSCVRVSAGATVTFSNVDAGPHTVTTDAGQQEQFDSGTLGPGATFTHAFAPAGTVHLHCTVHPEMLATVVVQ